ncbi:hypothetical protein [Marinobacterium aestuariivivens]|uniref:Alpha/beta hydrolase n=1 Tax=Marinobacterium aestuariivivens TaxID=1698799 RepID=A0ABW2A674_9GAMM
MTLCDLPIRWRRTAALLLLLSISGCSLAPAGRFDNEARRLGFSKSLVMGAGFEHVLFSPAPMPRGPLLHVYLAGDGSPWLDGRWPAADPTPRKPLMLQLMAQDPAPRLYLGRPCYHAPATPPACTPDLWTDGRYSQMVVDSLAAALQQWRATHDYQGLILFGYSGGGTLAMLLAERLPDTRAVVTLAANLDPQRWATHHGYRPLQKSLNPAVRPPLPGSIHQLHLTGGRDRNVPVDLVEAAIVRQPSAQHLHFAAFDHRCCWRSAWPGLLETLARRLDDGPRPVNR